MTTAPARNRGLLLFWLVALVVGLAIIASGAQLLSAPAQGRELHAVESYTYDDAHHLVPTTLAVSGDEVILTRLIGDRLTGRVVSRSLLAAEGAGDAGVLMRTFQTYTKVNAETGGVYVGRTSGFGSPPREPCPAGCDAYNDLGFGPAELDQTSPSKWAIRGREQQMIDFYREQGILANKINGISPSNPNIWDYLNAATQAFGGG